MLKILKKSVSGLTLEPSSGGAFEVTVEGELIFSKLQEKRFPEPEEIMAALP